MIDLIMNENVEEKPNPEPVVLKTKTSSDLPQHLSEEIPDGEEANQAQGILEIMQDGYGFCEVIIISREIQTYTCHHLRSDDST